MTPSKGIQTVPAKTQNRNNEVQGIKNVLATPLGKLQVAVGIALKHPKYVNSVGGDYKFNYRKELWDKRIEPYMLQHGKGYEQFDREAFLASGQLKTQDHHNSFEVVKEGIVEGELNIASMTSNLAHFVATSPFYGDKSPAEAHIKDATEQKIDHKFNQFQDWVGQKRSASEERLQEVTNGSIQDWMLSGVGNLLPQLPLWYLGGEVTAALDAGLPTVTATGAKGIAQGLMRKAIIDAGEGIGYTALDDPKSWKDYAQGAGSFAVANPVMRYVGKLIGFGGHEWERKNIAAAVQHFADKEGAAHAINVAASEGGFNRAGLAKVENLIPTRGAADIALDKKLNDPVIQTHVKILNAMAKYMHGRSGFQFLNAEQRLGVVQNFGKIFKMAMERPVEAAPELAVPVITKSLVAATGMEEKLAQQVAKGNVESVEAARTTADKAEHSITETLTKAAEAHGMSAPDVDVHGDGTVGAASNKSLAFYNNMMKFMRDRAGFIFGNIGVERGENKKNGKVIPSVAVFGKSSLLFLLDRTNGKPLYDVTEKAVMQSEVPAENFAHAAVPLQAGAAGADRFHHERHRDGDAQLEEGCRKLIEDNHIQVGMGPYAPPTYNHSRVIFPSEIGGRELGRRVFQPGAGLSLHQCERPGPAQWREGSGLRSRRSRRCGGHAMCRAAALALIQ